MIKALIIEDEIPAQINLERLIGESVPDIEVIGRTHSVAGSVAWLGQNDPDLIFMDVELADGVCFEIFRQTEIKACVIITTAYDRYALKAFEVNSVDYLLKPVNKEALVRAVDKCRKEIGRHEPNLTTEAVQRLLELTGTQLSKQRFVVKLGDRIIAVNVSDIAYFVSEDKSTFIVTKSGKRYYSDLTLDAIEESADRHRFFRASRNTIVTADAIQSIHKYFNGRLKLKLEPPNEEEVTVSRQRTGAFLEWLEG